MIKVFVDQTFCNCSKIYNKKKMSEGNPETDEEEEEEVQAYVDVLQEFLAHGEVQDIDEEGNVLIMQIF